MIALTAGEPPLEVPRTPFALFCSSMKRKKSAKKTYQNFRDLFRQTVSYYFSSLPLFPFAPHHVLGLYHFPLSIRFLFWWGRVEGVVGIHPTRQNLPNGNGLVSSSYFMYFKLHFMFPNICPSILHRCFLFIRALILIETSGWPHKLVLLWGSWPVFKRKYLNLPLLFRRLLCL